MVKKITLVLSLSLLIITGFYYFVINPTIEVYSEGDLIKDDYILNSDVGIVYGKEMAENKLIVYSDYNCIACKDFHNMLTENGEITKLIESGFISITYKDLGTSKHNSKNAAKAALAAHDQGAYTSMQEILFSNEDWLKDSDESIFYHYAAQLNLDIDEFDKSFNSKKIVKELKNIKDEFDSLGAIGTPILIYNERIYNGAPKDIENFLTIINADN